ncbi:D-arginine dehydrogenase [Nocardioides zeae]|uniref:D-arginine dehydrogenase n=2 Tax=Nocardioides zeae TaxID=1457234 RepID=A0ACC6IK32_9ACTN|nr:FAD-binding oxidoreductase [Nocardioides zeae]MDQ1106681.1 D-arginine dehydrogenase [Nocardioides zeae]MDR6173656.1 D-arginine dehydrogenase [Nocardioides zeae]MDR6211061.1 D-arginine dehydrogenase [Nocardioides zeae]
MTVQEWDVIVIGGGIAGVSIAYELAADTTVCLLETESTLAYHSTGRSAAAFIESYGNLPIRALTVASRGVFTDPPDIFESAVSRPLPLLYVAGEGRAGAIRSLQDQVRELTPDIEVLDAAEAERRHPLLRPGHVELALWEPGALDLDVHALHQGYAKGLRGRGGHVATSARVVEAVRARGRWTLTDGSGRQFRAPVVVNAAGAWCDAVAAVLGVEPIGIQPLRRTVFMVPAPAVDPDRPVPLTIDVDDRFYFKPETDMLLCSPADETPQAPGDAKPDTLDIAMALDAINDATTIDARHVRHSWAGLRSFTADRTPVVGYDPAADGVFWFAGQGGYGIQAGPALARTGAALLRRGPVPADVAERGLRAEMLAPGRPSLSVSEGTVHQR